MRILYFSLCDWNWIKQRPQYLAEELTKYNDLVVLYPNLWWAKNTSKNKSNSNSNENGLVFKKMFALPKYRTIRLIGLFVSFINRIIVKHLVKKYSIDVIWISHPDQATLIPKGIRYVYDCMDNYSMLEHKKSRTRIIEKRESALLKNASIVFVSSLWLYNNCLKQYGAKKETIKLIRNAYNGKPINVLLPTEKPLDAFNERISVCYFGTIAQWFDWDTLLDNRIDFVEYHIYGPISGVTIPNDKRVVYHGIVEHDALYEEIKKYDALIMPFKVNQLIEAVDPVKLYEYINFGKCIISVWYEEINRFDPFVWFYKNNNDYFNVLLKIKEQKCNIKYDNKMRMDFLRENTWQRRVECIQEFLDTILK